MLIKSLSESVMYSTVQLVTNTGSGTGFFFTEKIDETTNLSYIITNRHVIEGDSELRVVLHCADPGVKESNGTTITYDFDNFGPASFIPHPNTSIDLCIIPFGNALNKLNAQNIFIYFAAVTRELLISQEELEQLNAIEDVTMVGYPIGLADEVNNFPLMRRGITASHPNVDFRKTPQGMIDIAVFSGSSGSPIYLLNENGYRTNDGQSHIGGTRLKLLGVLWGGPVMEIDGGIEIREIPTKQEAIAVTAVRIHLGYYIKAREILILVEYVLSLYRQNNQPRG